ncbi:MAG: hypothetical protein K0U47_10885 [Epsilonproteobacteria bacterium]|nr:hypothetical protein [Campylobacterota bacterium]
METGATYLNYIAAAKNLQPFEGRTNYQTPYAEGFEAIYTEASHQDIKLSNAKEFLKSLSNDEVQTLQKYSNLADAINIDALSPEGAYNLLMHDHEQYDFNSDGVAEVGIAQKMLPIPINMPTDTHDAYINAINNLDDKDKLMASALTFDTSHLKSVLSDKPYTPPLIDYTYLKNRVEQILNPKEGGYSAQEFKTSVRDFWEVFESHYTGSREITPQEETRDPAIEKFLKDLREKGATQFLADLNQEKIDKKIEDYKNNLIAKLGDSPQALATIEKLVEEFKKQLLEEMATKLEKSENNIVVTTQTMVQTLLNLKDNDTSTTETLLQKLLREKEAKKSS